MPARPFGQAGRLLAAAGFCACLATGLGFFGCLFWLAELPAHFRVQLLLVLTGIGTFFLLIGRRRLASLHLLAAAVNLLFVLPMHVPAREARTRSDGDRLRVMLFNVNAENSDSPGVSQAVRTHDPDLLVLLELDARWLSELAWLGRIYPHQVVRSREDSFGLGLFSRLPLAQAEVVLLGQAGLPSILAIADTGRNQVRIVAAHPMPPLSPAMAERRNEQLDLLADLVQSSPLPQILLGDLNLTPWSCRFRRLIRRSSLVDGGKGFGVQPTWPSSAPLLGIPIDHVLHSASIATLQRRVGPAAGSDHLAVVADLLVGQAARHGSSCVEPVNMLHLNNWSTLHADGGRGMFFRCPGARHATKVF